MGNLIGVPESDWLRTTVVCVTDCWFKQPALSQTDWTLWAEFALTNGCAQAKPAITTHIWGGFTWQHGSPLLYILVLQTSQ